MTNERAPEDLGDRFDAVLRMIVADDAEIASVEGRRARHLAEAASLADRMAQHDGSAATVAGREWARRKLASEIGSATRRSERAVNRLVDEGERLVEQLPLTLGALEKGTISYAHARAMIGHAITLPESARAPFEQQLLPHATTLPAYRFDDKARRLRERAHPESMIARTKAANEERHVMFTAECDGMATIHHHLPVVDALAIDDLADKVARSERSETDGRTHAQRRSDALADLILGRSERPRITPTVLVTAPAATIAGIGDEPAELHGYGPIDADTARAIAAKAPAFLRALLSHDTGEPVIITRHRHRPVAGPPSNGRDRYSESPTMRTALALLDETCRFPGCGRRANRCELDHTHAWAEGGTTTPENLTHLCSRHHHLKHDGGWKVTAARDGTRALAWTSPRGIRYTTSPPGALLPPPRADESPPT